MDLKGNTITFVRLNIAATVDSIEKYHQIVLYDRLVKVREIVCFSKEYVCHILTKHSSMKC